MKHSVIPDIIDVDESLEWSFLCGGMSECCEIKIVSPKYTQKGPRVWLIRLTLQVQVFIFHS